MRYLLTLSISLLWFSCQSNLSENQAATENLSLEKEQMAAESQASIDSQWAHLVFEKGGCLTGGQRIKNGKFGGAECVMSRSKDWTAFFNREQEALHTFLLSKLADTIITRIHTCPFFDATAGEVAVYSLQNLYKVNWYDFEEFQNFKTKEAISADENEQAWLQAILEDEEKRAILINYWNEQAKE